RWITVYSRQRSERTMAERLANEILDAINSVAKCLYQPMKIMFFLMQTTRRLSFASSPMFRKMQHLLMLLKPAKIFTK
ncbi:MAG: hypothetical protein IKB92_04190, partial [Clostridia bacterium]|nr:hypothetical protein [Clostridia bacterium]